VDALRPAVERALSESMGSSVRARGEPQVLRAMPSGYATVARFGVASGTGTASSVVVKRPGDWGPYEPDSTEGTAGGLFSEWAALELLNVADATLAPRLLGADRANGFLVLEDLGGGDGIADLVLGADANAAREGLVGFARTLGRMHAVTSGGQDAYQRRRRELGPLPDADRHYAFDRFIPAFGSTCERLGVDVVASASEEAEAVVAEITAPRMFVAYTHGDPCPDNTRIVDGRVVLIDFEIGGFRHAFLDGAYGAVPFPTCWCVNRIPESIVGEMDDAYRTELATAFPEAADDDVFADAMLSAMAFWAMATTGWQVERVLAADEPMHRGIHTRRQGAVLRWETFIARAEALGRLGALADLGRAVLSRLATLWPDLGPVPLYPAFRSGDTPEPPGR
jgi:hypothetical protein